ncbi:fimbria/pilus periplasmic chaperone [Klebsiella indica]|uniref:Molecular chaperone n=1 Tax=Klebsiella indica TaxID=2582917 RepID=A0A5R9LIT2_9ENTR|nr:MULTISPECIES: fimbria/pilus periplasmic chaperone [Klebsiella]TLV19231.1 molecular chaperone [Klebsiella indica]
MLKKIPHCLILIVSFFISAETVADVAINGTRIIFNAKDKESVVQLKNNGKNPYLLQLWIDDGNPKSRPGEVTVPFIITPPVVRIDPNKGQAARIMFTDASLPQDRESLYWFNMLEVPPKPTKMIEAGTNLLQLAFRTRIKLFYRPAGLEYSALESYKKLKFNRKGNTLNIKNDSPYFITLSSVDVRRTKESAIVASVENFPQRMIAPKGETNLQLVTKKSERLDGLTLFYSVINDYGGETKNEQVLQSK